MSAWLVARNIRVGFALGGGHRVLTRGITRIDSELVGDDEEQPECFRVHRTNYGELPVYHDYKNGGTRKLTIVRKFTGDAEELMRQLKALCESDRVELRTGRIEIKGLHRDKVKRWLQGRGF